MFGERLDYWMLRPLVHGKLRASETELNARFNEPSTFDEGAAQERIDKLVHRFNGQFAVEADKRYLDVGCGRGDLDVALVKRGAGHVTGIDPIKRNIDAAQLAAQDSNVSDQTQFTCTDVHEFFPETPFDAVFSHEALEHISEPGLFIQKLRNLIHNDGVIYLAFGPLFHSPFGDHLDSFFKVQLPWRGVLFSERALMKLRREHFRPGDPVNRFEDMAGGMNKMRFSQYLDFVEQAGLQTEYMGLNPQLQRFKVLNRVANRLYKVPVVQDYLTMSVYAKLRVKN